MDEGLQVVLVGHAHGVVRGVHPPHRQLQRLAAAHGAQGRGRGINLLGFHAGGGKEGVGGDGLEEGEVGHSVSSSLSLFSSIFFRIYGFVVFFCLMYSNQFLHYIYNSF